MKKLITLMLTATIAIYTSVVIITIVYIVAHGFDHAIIEPIYKIEKIVIGPAYGLLLVEFFLFLASIET